MLNERVKFVRISSPTFPRSARYWFEFEVDGIVTNVAATNNGDSVVSPYVCNECCM
jgi:hypothetical protein